jgi:hypothetical protein
MEKHQEHKPKSKAIKWLKNLGVGAFLFFLIKGLIWLAVFFGLWELISGSS